MIEQDSRWLSFEGIPNNFNDFSKRTVPEIYLKPEVHEDIKMSFRVIKRLMEFSFYEYEFFDVAADNAILVLEMAFKIRYQELTGKIWEKKPLHQLIDWHTKNETLEIYDNSFLETVRTIRNFVAHPNHYGFGGLSMLQWVLHPMDLINDMYEDIELRRIRINKTRELNNELKTISKVGCTISLPNGEKFIVHDIDLLFYNNKTQANEISVLWQPIFEIPEHWLNDDGLIYGSDFKPLTFSTLEKIENKLIGKTIDGNIIKIEPINNNQNLKRFKEFNNRFAIYNKHDLYKFSKSTSLGAYYNQKRRAFHKQ